MTKDKLRYISAVALGASLMAVLEIQLSAIHPIFWQLGESGLIAPILSGVIGGVFAGLIVPNRRVLVAATAGAVLTIPLMLFLLRNGFSHYDRTPVLWYWPIWLTPAAAVGGFLVRKSKPAAVIVGCAEH